MNLRERIGIDLGQRNRIEDGLQAAIKHGVRYLDLKIDVAPNAIETLTDERVASIRRTCEAARHSCRHSAGCPSDTGPIPAS